MKTTDLMIPEPCNVEWASMSGDERRRFCTACDKHVTHLSTFTQAAAKDFLLDNPGACVQMDVLGDTILFEPVARSSSTFRRRGWLRRVAWVGISIAGTSPALASSNADTIPEVSITARSKAWLKSFFVEDPVVTEPVVVTVVEPTQKPIKPMVEPYPIPLGGAPMISDDYRERLERERQQLDRADPERVRRRAEAARLAEAEARRAERIARAAAEAAAQRAVSEARSKARNPSGGLIPELDQ